VAVFEWDETVAYNEEGQYVGQIERKEEGRVQLEMLQNHIVSIRSFSKRKKIRCCHLEGPSTMPSTLRKRPSPLGA